MELGELELGELEQRLLGTTVDGPLKGEFVSRSDTKQREPGSLGSLCFVTVAGRNSHLSVQGRSIHVCKPGMTRVSAGDIV